MLLLHFSQKQNKRKIQPFSYGSPKNSFLLQKIVKLARADISNETFTGLFPCFNYLFQLTYFKLHLLEEDFYFLIKF